MKHIYVAIATCNEFNEGGSCQEHLVSSGDVDKIVDIVNSKNAERVYLHEIYLKFEEWRKEFIASNPGPTQVPLKPIKKFKSGYLLSTNERVTRDNIRNLNLIAAQKEAMEYSVWNIRFAEAAKVYLQEQLIQYPALIFQVNAFDEVFGITSFLHMQSTMQYKIIQIDFLE